MNKEDRAILYGISIGDGSVSYRKRLKDGKYEYITSELSVSHGPKQKDYLIHKKELVESILGGKKLGVQKNTHKVGGKVHHTYGFSKTNKYFQQIYHNLYKSGKKRLTSKVLSYLDEHSLALWIMDDSRIGHNKNKQGEVTSLHFEISSQCDSEEEAKLISDWLKNRFSIESRVCTMKGRYNVRGGTQATLNLCRIIEPYVIPCMMYKIAPSFRFVFRKSARHPNFTVDDEIVRTSGNEQPEEN